MRAALLGTFLEPFVRIECNPDDNDLDRNGVPVHRRLTMMSGAVSTDPIRHWWEIRSFPHAPSWVLDSLGLAETPSHIDGFNGGIDELVTPAAHIDETTGKVTLYRRFGSAEHLAKAAPPGAGYNRSSRRWECRAHEMVNGSGVLRPGLKISPDSLTVILELANKHRVLSEAAAEAGTRLTVEDLSAATRQNLGSIPDSFQLPLDPYQITGALAVAAGHTLLCDEMGVGKTRTALAAVAVFGADRCLIVTPPVVVPNWVVNVEEAGFTETIGPLVELTATTPKRIFDAPLPESGVVVVTDGLPRSRPQLEAALADWLAGSSKSAILMDEAHRFASRKAARTKAVMAIASHAAFVVPITGSPVTESPMDLLTMLEMTGHLGPVFEGFGGFTAKYLYKDHFNVLCPRKRRLAELEQVLTEKVWVRRTKAQVAPDLPTKRRQELVVQCDLSEYRKAHTAIALKVDEWLELLDDGVPSEDDIREFCTGNLGLLSPLREACGLWKIPAAVQYVEDWLAAKTGRPLIVWVHHKSVANALVEKLGTVKGCRFATIMGTTSAKDRASIVEQFQEEGSIDVLVASISAAGVGITLTRCSDALFVETDWRANIVVQAEDRIHRRGQPLPCLVTTMVAPKTLDPHIHGVLAQKIQTLNKLTPGSDHEVTTWAGADRSAVNVCETVVREILNK